MNGFDREKWREELERDMANAEPLDAEGVLARLGELRRRIEELDAERIDIRPVRRPGDSGEEGRKDES